LHTPTSNLLLEEGESMKTNHMSDVTKVLILVATVIVVCVICAIGFKMVNEGKSAVNASTNNFNNMTSQYSEIDKSIYDGATVQGSEVVNFIKKSMDNNEYLAIVVKTKENSLGVHYNYTFHYPDDVNAPNTLSKQSSPVQLVQDQKNDANYINTSAQFSGKIYKDSNNIIICIEFTQL